LFGNAITAIALRPAAEFLVPLIIASHIVIFIPLDSKSEKKL
jgi:hypothetical protein